MHSYLILILFCAHAAWAQTKLTVKSADSKQIELAWSGSSAPVVVERRSAGGRYETLATVKEGAAYRDGAIDSMGIYQYRVHGATAGSANSNEVTAGAPPVGYSVPLAMPKAFIDKELRVNFARSTAMELDSNGDPAFLYSVIDPAFQGSKDAELWFLHWDRALWRWKAAVKVAGYENTRDGVSLAREGATWATVTETEKAIELHVSTDDGATWSPKHRLPTGDNTRLGRAVALAGGRIYWGYRVGSEGVYLITGMLSGKPEEWKSELLPMNSLDMGSPGSQVVVAADSQGRAGVAYFGYGPDYNTTALYWRPGEKQARKIMDSNGVQNDFHSGFVKKIYG